MAVLNTTQCLCIGILQGKIFQLHLIMITYSVFFRNIDLPVSVDSKCSLEGCWYCKNLCHSCLRPAAIGYTHKTSNGELLKHCSKRCYHMYTSNSTFLDITVAELLSQLERQCGQVLLSATSLTQTIHSKNMIMSTLLAVAYDSKDIPSGVVFLYLQSCSTKQHTSLNPVFIQHDLIPSRSVYIHSALDIQSWREEDTVRKVVEPLLEKLGCKDLPSFLHAKFPSLKAKFMDCDGKVYSMEPTGKG